MRRYIDADKLQEAFKELHGGKRSLLIDTEPTADVRENVRGEWTQNFDGNEWYWFCSNCKEKWYEEDLWMGGNDFPNFCPNCGADMRGETNDRNNS